MCHERPNAAQQNSRLFDHLIGAGEQRRWHFELDRSRSLQVDHKLEVG
jgi:hypothetical protein